MVYLLHFSKPIGAGRLGQAQHYLGYTEDLDRRIKEHRKGWSSPIVRAFHAKGIPFEVARTWDEDRTFERRLKTTYKNARRLCPVCRQQRNIK